MSISKIRRAYEIFNQQHDTYLQFDEEVIDLVNAIAEYILKNPSPDPDYPKTIPEGYITTMEFGRKYKIFSSDLVTKYCRKDKIGNTSIKAGRIWYVHPQKTVDYLKKNVTRLTKWADLFSSSII